MGDRGAEILRHGFLVNNEKFADTIFKFPKRQLFAHSCVLNARVPKLICPDPKRPPKRTKGLLTVEMKEYRFTETILLEILQYAYTDEYSGEKLSHADLLQLTQAAVQFEISRLNILCTRLISGSLKMDNIFHFLKGAHELKLDQIKLWCFKYIMANYKEVITNQEGSQILGLGLYQEVVTLQTIMPAQPEDKPVPPSSLVRDFKSIFDTMNMECSGKNQKAPYDVVFFKTGSSVPEYVPCHKSVLGAQVIFFLCFSNSKKSPQLTALCSTSPTAKSKDTQEHVPLPGNKQKDGKSGAIISAEAFRSLLRFVYYGDQNIAPSSAVELIPFAHDFGLEKLQDVCEQKIQVSIDSTTALPILAVTYTQQMEASMRVVMELRQNSIDYILQNLNTIDLSPLQANPQMAVDILMNKQRRDRKTNGPKTPRFEPISPSTIRRPDGFLAKTSDKNEDEPPEVPSIESSVIPVLPTLPPLPPIQQDQGYY